MRKLAVILVMGALCASCGGESKSKENPENGDLNQSFVEKEKEKMLADGWKEEEISNGQFSNCYNFSPRKGSVDNHLEVTVGSGTDVSIKVMNAETDECVRFVFINSGSTYKIKNIPEGTYYLKIAYGKNWLSKVVDGQCVGKFIENPMYEMGEDMMDFNVQRSETGYSIPSYTLELDVVSSGISNSFNSQNISEGEFNK